MDNHSRGDLTGFAVFDRVLSDDEIKLLAIGKMG